MLIYYKADPIEFILKAKTPQAIRSRISPKALSVGVLGEISP
jgi:hypothetical protein